MAAIEVPCSIRALRFWTQIPDSVRAVVNADDRLRSLVFTFWVDPAAAGVTREAVQDYCSERFGPVVGGNVVEMVRLVGCYAVVVLETDAVRRIITDHLFPDGRPYEQRIAAGLLTLPLA